MPVVIVLAFAWAPKAEILGHTSRVIYFHVPLAWVSVLAFLVAAVDSIRYLSKGDRKYSAKSPQFSHHRIRVYHPYSNSGSLWAKMSWGSYWNWDPRESSIAILMLIYIAYFSLYSALEGNPGRGRISSVYLILAMVTFLLYICCPAGIPLLHPDTIINSQGKMQMEAACASPCFPAFLPSPCYMFTSWE
jgi:heme exporter protein C